jgi:hypothetical protein
MEDKIDQNFKINGRKGLIIRKKKPRWSRCIDLPY